MKNWLSSSLGAIGNAWARQKPARRDAQNRYRPALEVLEDRVQPSISLGAAGAFAVLGVNGGNVNLNSSTITGDIGLGPNVTSILQKTNATGNLVVDPTATPDLSRLGNNFDITGSVIYQDLSQANADANAASSAFAALAPTQTLDNVTGSVTISGNGSLNVISVSSLSYKSATMTLSGGASDEFVFNVSGDFSFYQSTIQLSGGVTADHVLFNFPTTGSLVDFSKDANVVNGTVLAPWRSVNYHNPAAFNGAIIAQEVSIHSSGILNYVGFTPPVSTSPATISGHAVDDSGASLAGVLISMRDSSGAIVQQATTDANGYYQLTNVPPGTYSLSAGKSTYRTISASAGTNNGDPEGTSGTATITDIGLSSGDVAIDYNFVLTPAGS